MTLPRLIAGLLLMAASAAWADGVPLITAGPAVPQSEPTRKILQAQPSVVKFHPVTINRDAFGANVLTIDVPGIKKYRFVGKMGAPMPGGIQTWSGKDGDYLQTGALLSLVRNPATGEVMGSITTLTRTYDIDANSKRSLLVERDPSLGIRALPMPASASTPAGIPIEVRP